MDIVPNNLSPSLSRAGPGLSRAWADRDTIISAKNRRHRHLNTGTVDIFLLFITAGQVFKKLCAGRGGTCAMEEEEEELFVFMDTVEGPRAPLLN